MKSLRRHLGILLVAVGVAGAAGLAVPTQALANHDHRKVYTFSLDALDRDAIAGNMPFLESLMAGEEGGATTFFNQSRSVMVAETNPNHTSMITGVYPERHGIAGNEFAFYGKPSEDESCPAGGNDNSKSPFPTSGQSTTCVEAPNLFETIEKRRNPKHITTAMVMGKPKLARLFSTRKTTKAGYDADYIWAPCEDNEPYCEDVPTNPATGYAATDGIVMDEVIRTTREKVLDRGRRRRPDFTFVNFPQIDSAGHATGRTSAAYASAARLMDAELRRFVDNQKQLNIWDRTLMMVVSDHSMDDTPLASKVSIEDTLVAGGVPENSFSVVGNGGAAHIYLTDRSSPNRFALLAKMRSALNSDSRIDQALYREPNPTDGGEQNTLGGARPEWGLDGERSGDIVTTTVNGVGVLDTSEASSFPFNPLPGNHGGEPTTDNTWILTGGHPGILQGTSGAPAVNVDVAPTAFRLLSRKPPRGTQGAYRGEAIDERWLGKKFRRSRTGTKRPQFRARR